MSFFNINPDPANKWFYWQYPDPQACSIGTSFLSKLATDLFEIRFQQNCRDPSGSAWIRLDPEPHPNPIVQMIIAVKQNILFNRQTLLFLYIYNHNLILLYLVSYIASYDWYFFFCLLGWFFCNYYRSVPIIDLFPLFLKLSLLSLLLILSFFFALLYLKICLYSMGLPSLYFSTVLFSFLFSIFFGLLFLYCLFFSPLFPDFSICSQHFTTVFLSHIFLLQYSTVHTA